MNRLKRDTSRKGNLRTLRLGEAGSGDSEGSEATLGHPFICVPSVIACQIDVQGSDADAFAPGEKVGHRPGIGPPRVRIADLRGGSESSWPAMLTRPGIWQIHQPRKKKQHRLPRTRD